MNAQHQSLAKSLNDLFISLADKVPDLNAIPYLTRLSGQFEADEAGSSFGAPELLHLVDQIGAAMQIAGTMAANNLQGAETRRAHASNEAPVQYPAFTWIYTPAGTLADRLNAILQAPFALDKATNQAPPPPPQPVDPSAQAPA